MNKAFIPTRYFAKDFRSGDFFFVLHRLIGLPVDQSLNIRPQCYFWHIYSVQIQTDDENNLQEIYGKIKVHDSVIFDRSDDTSPHVIDEEGFVRLKGPMLPFDGDLTNMIKIKLRNGYQIEDDNHDINEDVSGGLFNESFSTNCYRRSSFDAPGLKDRVSRGLSMRRDNYPVSVSNPDTNRYPMIPFHASRLKDHDASSSGLKRDVKIKNGETCRMQLFDMKMVTKSGVLPPEPCNEILSKMIDIEGCGRVKVTYSIFEDSADCFLTIRLLNFKGSSLANCKGTSHANVFGHVRTSNGLFEGDDRAKSLIYDRKRDEKQRVKPGQYIELLRPVNVLPMGDTLNVEVNILHEYLNTKNVSAIASGTCSFRAKCTYNNRISWRFHDHKIVDSRNISGPLGTIQVRAYWLPYWCFSYYRECYGYQ